MLDVKFDRIDYKRGTAVLNPGNKSVGSSGTAAESARSHAAQAAGNCEIIAPLHLGHFRSPFE